MNTYRSALEVLGDPTRRSVFELLEAGPRSVGSIAADLPVSRPAVSQHLRVLKEAGLVTDVAEGNRRLYRMDPSGLAALHAYVERFWTKALDRFKEEVDLIPREGEQMKSRAPTATAPVRLSITVEASQERAFRVFTEDIGKWWPVETHSIDPPRVARAHMECRQGGRIVQFGLDGSETRWGDVLAWEPPTRLVFSWNPSLEDRPDTEIEVTFTPSAQDGTVVRLEHRGWEHLDEGHALRANYETGWVPVLDRYRDQVHAPEP